MTDNEEVLLQQFFSSRGIDKSKRDFYINLILSSKELQDSEFGCSGESIRQYDIVMLSLVREGKRVSLNGAISNGVENKWIQGSISGTERKQLLSASIDRLSDMVPDSEKIYEYFETFEFGEEGVTRTTVYGDGREFKSKIDMKTQEELEEYYRGKIGTILKR